MTVSIIINCWGCYISFHSYIALNVTRIDVYREEYSTWKVDTIVEVNTNHYYMQHCIGGIFCGVKISRISQK